jgi:hypothetical protein
LESAQWLLKRLSTIFPGACFSRIEFGQRLKLAVSMPVFSHIWETPPLFVTHFEKWKRHFPDSLLEFLGTVCAN